MTDQKLVMAHVYGHCDFFKNNYWFSHTNRKMMDEMANHGNRVRRYMDRFGVEEVEKFIDACLSIEDLIDHPLAAHQAAKPTGRSTNSKAPTTKIQPPCQAGSRPNGIWTRYVNPPEVLAAEAEHLRKEKSAKKDRPADRSAT